MGLWASGLVGLWPAEQIIDLFFESPGNLWASRPLGLIIQVSWASGPPGDLLGGLFRASLEASWGPPGGPLGASWGLPGASGRALGAEVEF